MSEFTIAKDLVISKASGGRSITTDGIYIYMAVQSFDEYDQNGAILKFDTNLELLESYNLGDETKTVVGVWNKGLECDDEYLYVAATIYENSKYGFKVEKIRLSDLQRVGIYKYSNYACCVLTIDNNYIYVATETDGSIFRISKDTMTLVGKTVIPDLQYAEGIYQDGQYLYISWQTEGDTPGTITKTKLSDMSLTNSITLTGISYPGTINCIDAHLYVVCDTYEAQVLKILKSDLSVIENQESAEEVEFKSACTDNKYLYAGSVGEYISGNPDEYQTAPMISKIDLNNFSNREIIDLDFANDGQVNALVLLGNYLYASVYSHKISNGNWKARLIKIQIEGSENMGITASGSPLDAYDIIIAIADSGGLNAGTFRYSLDGGNNYSKKITIPAAGNYEIPDTGVSLEFTGNFTAGDTFTFKTIAPKASIESIVTAIDVLLNSKLTYELIHIVGESDAVMWAALAAKAAEAQTNFRWIHFVCEAQGLSEDVYSGMMDVDGWANALVEEASFRNTRVSVVTARAEIADITGRVAERNAAGLYIGRLVSGKVSQSPGKVMLGSMPGVVKLTPEGINDAHITMLDEAGFITFREYEGYDGVYVTNGRMMAEEGSDYTFVECRRTMDKACRLVRLAALRFMHAEATNSGLDDLEARLTSALGIMKADGEITSARVVIPRNQNLLAGEKLKVKIRAVPIPIMRDIEVEIGFENPFATT